MTTPFTMRDMWTKKGGDDASSDESDEEWDEEPWLCAEDFREKLNVSDEEWPYFQAIFERKTSMRDLEVGVPTEMIPGKLYIGDSSCVRAEYTETLRSLGITAVLNVAANQGSPADQKYLAPMWKKGIEDETVLYKAIACDDDIEYPLLKNHWDAACEFLDRALAQGRPVLVHCVQGLNRSGLIVCAYYMLHTKTSLVPAVEFLRSKRGPEALKNPGFMVQLVRFAAEHDLLGEKTTVHEETA